MSRNLVNFHASSWNIQKVWKFAHDGFLLLKAYKVLDKTSPPWKKKKNLSKKLKKVISHDIGEWCKVWRKTDLGFKNDMTNFVNFNADSGKSENVHFDMPLLSVAFKVSPKKYRRVISHDSEKWSKLSKKNSFLVWKMTWGIWWILTRVVINLKICTLMGYICQKYM